MMRARALSILVILGLAIAGSSLTVVGATATTATTVAPVDAFVTRVGAHLYAGTQRVRFVGVNMYTANLRDNCVSGYSGGYANSVLSNDLAALDRSTSGHARFIRAWFFQHLATSNGQRDWSAFDHTLAVAKAAHVKVMAVLANGWGTCEAPTATDTNGVGYRDITWYQHRYWDSVDEGGTVSYRDWVAQVVARYQNDPTILAWQLINEGNAGTYVANANGKFPCPDTAAAHEALLGWADDMSSLVKGIDGHHLVSVGTLNNSCGTWHGANISIAAVAGNDLCDYHDYSAPSTTMPTALSNMITACARIGRPTIVSEVGISASSVGYDLALRAARFGVKAHAAFGRGAIAGYVPWVWNGSSQSLDSRFELKPSDPALPAVGQYGVRLSGA
jgi:hypothetical protein